MEKHIEDYWNLEGDRKLSDAWTGFTRFILLNERQPDGYTWSGGGTYQKTKNLSSWRCMARYVDAYVRCGKEESKTKMGNRETQIDNAGQLKGIFFIGPHDEEFKLIIKAAHRNLEVLMPAAMPCKIPMKSSGETRNARQDLLVKLMPTKARDQG